MGQSQTQVQEKLYLTEGNNRVQLSPDESFVRDFRRKHNNADLYLVRKEKGHILFRRKLNSFQNIKMLRLDLFTLETASPSYDLGFRYIQRPQSQVPLKQTISDKGKIGGKSCQIFLQDQMLSIRPSKGESIQIDLEHCELLMSKELNLRVKFKGKLVQVQLKNKEKLKRWQKELSQIITLKDSQRRYNKIQQKLASTSIARFQDLLKKVKPISNLSAFISTHEGFNAFTQYFFELGIRQLNQKLMLLKLFNMWKFCEQKEQKQSLCEQCLKRNSSSSMKEVQESARWIEEQLNRLLQSAVQRFYSIEFEDKLLEKFRGQVQLFELAFQELH